MGVDAFGKILPFEGKKLFSCAIKAMLFLESESFIIMSSGNMQVTMEGKPMCLIENTARSIVLKRRISVTNEPSGPKVSALWSFKVRKADPP